MNGRIYDPKLGRFLQADPFIQAPGNTQSYNRYSYVFNNPLKYTDPSGYFSFKDVVKIAVAVVVAYATYGAVNTWASAAFSTTTTTTASVTVGGAGTVAGAAATTASVTTSVTTLSTAGSIASGAIAGASAGFVSGAILTGSLKGAAQGAFTGAAFGGIGGYFGNTWNTKRAAVNGFAGGVSAKASGRKFIDGLKISLAASLAQTYFTKTLGYEANWERGINDPNGNNTYTESFGVPQESNTWGVNKPFVEGEPWYTRMWKQQSSFSKFMDSFPGQTSLSKLHDHYQIGFGQSDSILRLVGNAPAMIPAAGITYSALITTPVGAAVTTVSGDMD